MLPFKVNEGGYIQCYFQDYFPCCVSQTFGPSGNLKTSVWLKLYEKDLDVHTKYKDPRIPLFDLNLN